MYVKRAFLLGLLCMSLLVPSLVDAAATKEKCKCDLETANDNQDGADVSNASKCYLVSDEDRDWCTFDVESLNSSTSDALFDAMLRERTRTQNYDEIVEMFTERFRAWIMWGKGAVMLNEFGVISPEDLIDKISGALANRNHLFLSCVQAFVAGGSEWDRQLEQEDGFGCGVHSNGWLTLVLDFDRFVVYYLRGPLD